MGSKIHLKMRNTGVCELCEKGIRPRANTVFYYEREKTDFQYLYCEREVLEDDIHTIPVDMEIQ